MSDISFHFKMSVFFTVQPSIRTLKVCGNAGAYPGCHWAERRGTTWTGRLSITGLTYRESVFGKSSLTIQFVEGQFVDSYDPTIENTFTKMMTVNGQEYNLQLVDTAGQDEYSIFPQSYTIDVDGYILIYSVTSYKSFEVVRVIHEKLLDMVGNVQVPLILVGNKKDLHMERVISFEEGKALAESWNAAFLESSAKENQTAVEVFRRMILEVEKMEAGQPQGRTPCSMM
ncbi:GTP-binding protein Rheb-like isoform X1 [Anabas testudineus]|uniref:GTP-binding protein Rheb-like isoform X1 n=2 Tax=Anabas testudineus TaxID=64144 RepID=UPI000E453B96|nr:GTP-binding protein Rheb-like isoform X1 [Anabas testudineus]